MTAPQAGHRGPSLPWWGWVIVALGLILVMWGVVAWAAAERTPSGDPWIKNPDAIILALIGAGVTIAPLLIAWLRQISTGVNATVDHVVNSHGNRILRDDMDQIRAIAARAEAAAEHAVRANRQTAADVGQLREDVQGIRADMTGQASDIRGMRKDVGRLADHIMKEKP